MLSLDLNAPVRPRAPAATSPPHCCPWGLARSSSPRSVPRPGRCVPSAALLRRPCPCQVPGPAPGHGWTPVPQPAGCPRPRGTELQGLPAAPSPARPPLQTRECWLSATPGGPRPVKRPAVLLVSALGRPPAPRGLFSRAGLELPRPALVQPEGSGAHGGGRSPGQWLPCLLLAVVVSAFEFQLKLKVSHGPGFSLRWRHQTTHARVCVHVCVRV